MPSAPAIGFDFHPSPQLRFAACGVFALALGAILASGLHPGLRLLLAGGVSALALPALRRLRTHPVRAAGWQPDGHWMLHFHAGGEAVAGLRSFRILAGRVLLRLDAGAAGIHVLLLGPDNSDADLRRRLRMRLALHAAEAAVPRL